MRHSGCSEPWLHAVADPDNDKSKSDDAFATGLKWGLEKSVGVIAGMGYKTNCKAKNLDYKSDESWYCGLFATLSGEGEKEWKERVSHQLTAIRNDLNQIKAGINAILEGQQSIYNQNQQILVRLDEIGPETAVGKSISKVRVIFNEQYTPLFTGERPFTGQAVLAFARKVVFEDKIDRELGIIDDQLTHAIFGKETLLRSYARRMSLKMEATRDSRLEPAYDYLESVLDDLLAEQRKGYILYAWAAQTLQSACEMDSKNCAEFNRLPHTALQYRDIFGRHVAAQLIELQGALEWLALASSHTGSRQANFLHPDAERLFFRNDLFTAGNLGKGYGILGRVINMGEAKTFDGNLQLGGRQHAPANTTSVATSPGPVDWWRATGAPGVYDEVQFADRWQVYHYHLPQQGVGRLKIDTALPYRPAEVAVEMVTLTPETKVPFGSFTAISRVGGGYALLSGGWTKVEASDEKVIGAFNRRRDVKLADFAAPYAGIIFIGSLEWRVGDVGKDQHIEAERSAYAQSSKKIRFPQGGELTLHADFADTYSILCPNGAGCADYGHNTVITRAADFSKSPANREGEIDLRTVLLIDTAATGRNGIIFAKSNPFSSRIADDVPAAKNETARIRLDSQGRSLFLGGSLKMNLQTSGIGATNFLVAALAQLDNAWLTK